MDERREGGSREEMNEWMDGWREGGREKGRREEMDGWMEGGSEALWSGGYVTTLQHAQPVTTRVVSA